MNTNTQQKNSETAGGRYEVTGIASALSGASQLVQVFPASKEWYGADGRGPYRMSDPQKVVEESMAAQIIKFAMIDRDHARQLAAAGTPVKAAGWFKRYEARADGSVWGEVEWTASASVELSSREYRHFSATFKIDPDTREVLRITGGTLTNTPNFQDMQALASAEKPQNQPLKEINQMKPELLALAMALGLTATNTEEEIYAAALKSHEAHEKMKSGIKSVAEKLKLNADDNVEAIATAIRKDAEETAAKQAGSPDPEKYVPRAMFDELATRMTHFETASVSKAATEAVDNAIAGGKISPAQKDWAMEYATANLKGFQDFVSVAPKIVGDETAAQKKAMEDNGGLTQEDIEIARQMSVDIESLKKVNQKEGKAA